MTEIGVSITKTTSFRGVQQEFSNTYYYDGPLVITESGADALIDALVALEKPMHSSAVNFTFGRLWTAGGTKAENQMVKQKALTGSGTNSFGASTKMDKERAFLVRARAGNDSRGRPVYLRKWWHLDIAGISSVGIGDTQLQNTATLTTAQRSQLESWFNAFKSVTVGASTYTLISEKGRQITGNTEAHPYLEHHQLGDQWRV